jgi:ComF family protein
MANNYLRQLLSFLLETLFPRYCLGCAKPGDYLCTTCLAGAPLPEKICFACKTSSENGICPECARRLSLPHTKIFWATGYKYPPVQKLIRFLKYHSAKECAESIAILMKERLAMDIMMGGIIVPMPTHAMRFKKRGFNQAELIAQKFGELYALPLRSDILIKSRDTASQVRAASRAERLKNLRDSFAVAESIAIAGQKIILIDDVMTTGATIIEASRALRIAGAREVIAVVAAH